MNDPRRDTAWFKAQLAVAERDREALSLGEANPAAVRALLESLPPGDTTALAQTLYRLLPEIASLKASPGRVLALLAAARPAVRQAARHLGADQPVTPEAARRFSLAAALLRHLARGYQTVLAAACDLPATAPTVLAEAARGAAATLAELLALAWHNYVDPPPGCWLQLHATYALAHHKGVEKAVAEGTPGTRSAHSHYLEALLVAAADPYRYPPPDLEALRTFVARAGSRADFHPEEGLFVVDPTADEGPNYPFRLQRLGEHQFHLRTQRLARHLEQQLAAGSLEVLDERLARDLIRRWSQEVAKREAPLPDDSPATLTLGLSHIHRHLSRSRNLEEFLRKTGHGRDRELARLAIVEEERDHHDLFLRRTLGKFPTAAAPPLPTPAGRPLRRYPARRLETSAHGARFAFRAPEETLTAGEIVLVEPQPGPHWQLGLVRWNRITRSLERILGVEYLAEFAVPVAIVRGSGDRDEPLFPALLFAHGRGRRVVLPSLAFHPHEPVILIDASGRRPAQLGARVEATFHVSVFELHESPAG
ncbi:MAG: hypothetical protein KatS3mg124_0401 [Porticoccaceae bacterium]|nr:MAG: hypothetical protein KatS3mg124_0401 [Porticoccaceae bacterium]